MGYEVTIQDDRGEVRFTISAECFNCGVFL